MAKRVLLKGTISIKAGSNFLDALQNALSEYNEERFKTAIKKSKNSITIHVNASDATALRAGLNSYLRILQCLNELKVEEWQQMKN
ncbi:MAG: KEOPS complex subunit Pcc1 [Candidatus Anstonellales archaeon]